MTMKKVNLFVMAALVLVGFSVVVFTSCDTGNGSKESNGSVSGNEDPVLANVLPLLRHTLYVKEEYDKGNKPSSITNNSNTVIANIYYAANGALNEVRSSNFSSIFLYSQPLFISGYRREEAVDNHITKLTDGTYDYEADPAKAIGLFQNAIAANCNFNTLDDLKRLSNNSAITQDVFDNIVYPSGGQYRLIVFGKNSSGMLIGKYVGYATTYQSLFTYWCIDPESSSFGSRATKSLPNS
jgi:hypothetical protein